MNQDQFERACAEAIAPYHDLQEDGPLLASIRPRAKFDTCAAGGADTWQVWPTYAAVLAEWPDSRNGTNYGHYCDEPEEAIEALVRVAKGCWQARQPEPETDEDPTIVAERTVYDNLLN